MRNKIEMVLWVFCCPSWSRQVQYWLSCDAVAGIIT